MVYQFIIILSLRIDLFGGQSPIFRTGTIPRLAD